MHVILSHYALLTTNGSSDGFLDCLVLRRLPPPLLETLKSGSSSTMLEGVVERVVLRTVHTFHLSRGARVDEEEEEG